MNPTIRKIPPIKPTYAEWMTKASVKDKAKPTNIISSSRSVADANKATPKNCVLRRLSFEIAAVLKFLLSSLSPDYCKLTHPLLSIDAANTFEELTSVIVLWVLLSAVWYYLYELAEDKR